ncbi:iron uptake system protein EfeO [Microlunatus speluncae]|uniref:iron uptake system protein EfeO n=1 Tax=Microlunatus speluncae TaxID=2594267 RepID=UPI00126624B6|nr:iron uptake system protein EfeO [Microlunatus speluncae]
MIRTTRALPAALVPAALLLALTGCTDNATPGAAGPSGDPKALTVQASDSACAVSAAEAPSGNLTFTVTNGGSQVTEFYLLGADGLRIIGEVENIGPGLSRDLVLTAPPGGYFTACKPGMVGDGIRAAFTVTDSGADLSPSGDEAALVEQANQLYRAYVKDQTEQLLAATQKFADLYTGGSDEEARALYPEAREHWERIETVAESFGDLDPKMDLREADLAEGDEWTGWHRIEKDLWPARAKGYQALDAAGRKKYADDLVANTQELYDRTRDLTFTADQIGNGAKGLLDEVATGKVTGEEEYWSRTDLWDFQANVDGARIGYEGLKPLLQKRNPELEQQIGQRFTELQKLLDQHRDGEGFVLYDELTTDQIKQLSDAVNALSEPLSKMTAAVV